MTVGIFHPNWQLQSYWENSHKRLEISLQIRRFQRPQTFTENSVPWAASLAAAAFVVTKSYRWVFPAGTGLWQEHFCSWLATITQYYTRRRTARRPLLLWHTQSYRGAMMTFKLKITAVITKYSRAEFTKINAHVR